ncbi:MAG: lipopolysaccharide biosynthesis protein [Acidiferrobacterales bacterium]
MTPAPRLSDSAAWLIIGNTIQALSTFLLVLVLVRILPKEQFGYFQWVVLLLSTAASIATLGIPQSYLYFIPRSEAQDRRAFLSLGLVVQTAIGLLVGVCAAGSGFLVPGLYGVNGHGLFTLALLLFPVFYIITSSLPSIMLSIGRPSFSALSSIVTGVSYLGFAVTTAVASNSASAVFLAVTAAYGLAALGGAGLAYRSVPRGKRQIAGKQELRELIRYAMPLGASSLAGNINRRVDGMIVRMFFSASTFASFFIGAREIPFVSIFAFGITQAILPRISQAGTGNDHMQQIRLWQQAMLKTAIIIFPVFVFVFALAHRFIVLLFTHTYSDATEVFMIYLLLLPLRLSGYGAVLSAMGKPRLVLKGTLLGVVVNVVLGFLLIRFVGWTGPAIGAVASQLAMIVYFVRMIQKVSGVAWSGLLPLTRLGSIFLTALVPIPIALLIARFLRAPLPGFLAAGTFFFLGYFALAWILGVLTHDDKDFIRRWLRL